MQIEIKIKLDVLKNENSLSELFFFKLSIIHFISDS
jgi:hypothetical protein